MGKAAGGRAGRGAGISAELRAGVLDQQPMGTQFRCRFGNLSAHHGPLVERSRATRKRRFRELCAVSRKSILDDRSQL
jgi:hypothetical protein